MLRLHELGWGAKRTVREFWPCWADPAQYLTLYLCILGPMLMHAANLLQEQCDETR
jgi:hypothetical protein